MKIQSGTLLITQDISLLAINAAEELERFRRKMETDFNSAKELAKLLTNSFSKKVEESGGAYRLDHASVFSRAISNSVEPEGANKSLAELMDEAGKIATLLHSNTDGVKSKEEELKKLISFCVALSDSAALYWEEMEELKRHVA